MVDAPIPSPTPSQRSAIWSRALTRQQALIATIDRLLDESWPQRLGLVRGLEALRCCHRRHYGLVAERGGHAAEPSARGIGVRIPSARPSTALRWLFIGESRLQRRLARDSHHLQGDDRRLLREVLIPEIGAASAVLLDEIHLASTAA